MKTLWAPVMASMVLCAGCTTCSLEQYTLWQNRSGGEGRDAAVLNSLATVAADPNALPSYSLYTTGITSVTDSVSVAQASAWAPMKYTLETLGLTVSTSPKGQWTVDPVVEYQRLEALHAACLWALFDPESAGNAYPGILGDPNDYLDGKPHFAVEKRLERMSPQWVHCGRLKDVPLRARYKGHHGSTWVWILPEESESFAQFTLALQDIATLDPTIISSPPLLVTLTTCDVTRLADLTSDTAKKYVAIGTPETRVVKREYQGLIEQEIQKGMNTTGKVNLTRAQWMAYTEPWSGVRNPTGTTTTLPGRSSTQLFVPTPTPTPPGRVQPQLNFRTD